MRVRGDRNGAVGENRGMRRAITTAGSIILATAAGPSVAPAQGLILSEYVEGSSNNKAVELYNTGLVPIDLSTCSIDIYFNGNLTANNSIALMGTLGPGGTWVVAHANAGPIVIPLADQVSFLLSFNGDDVVALVRASAASRPALGGTFRSSLAARSRRAGFSTSPTTTWATTWTW